MPGLTPSQMGIIGLLIKANFGQKRTPGPLSWRRALIASSFRNWIADSYWTTVTARRFWLQQEMSLQIATGRSLPNDWLVMRWPFTPLETR